MKRGDNVTSQAEISVGGGMNLELCLCQISYQHAPIAVSKALFIYEGSLEKKSATSLSKVNTHVGKNGARVHTFSQIEKKRERMDHCKECSLPASLPWSYFYFGYSDNKKTLKHRKLQHLQDMFI